MTSDLTSLVDEVFQAKTSTKYCWRKRLEGDALKFIEAVEARSSEYNRAQVSRIFKDRFGFVISAVAIGQHVRKECSCER